MSFIKGHQDIDDISNHTSGQKRCGSTNTQAQHPGKSIPVMDTQKQYKHADTEPQTAFPFNLHMYSSLSPLTAATVKKPHGRQLNHPTAEADYPVFCSLTLL